MGCPQPGCDFYKIDQNGIMLNILNLQQLSSLTKIMWTSDSSPRRVSRTRKLRESSKLAIFRGKIDKCQAPESLRTTFVQNLLIQGSLQMFQSTTTRRIALMRKSKICLSPTFKLAELCTEVSKMRFEGDSCKLQDLTISQKKMSPLLLHRKKQHFWNAS